MIPQRPRLYPQTPRLGTEPPFQDAMDTTHAYRNTWRRFPTRAGEQAALESPRDPCRVLPPFLKASLNVKA